MISEGMLDEARTRGGRQHRAARQAPRARAVRSSGSSPRASSRSATSTPSCVRHRGRAGSWRGRACCSRSSSSASGRGGASRSSPANGRLGAPSRPLPPEGAGRDGSPRWRVLKAAGYTVTEVDAGCCGMAGSFGFEAEHYDLSIKIAERRLAPAVRGRRAPTWRSARPASRAASRWSTRRGACRSTAELLWEPSPAGRIGAPRERRQSVYLSLTRWTPAGELLEEGRVRGSGGGAPASSSSAWICRRCWVACQTVPLRAGRGALRAVEGLDRPLGGARRLEPAPQEPYGGAIPASAGPSGRPAGAISSFRPWAAGARSSRRGTRGSDGREW